MKRLFDLVLTVPAIIVLLPVFATLALVVRIMIGSPVLFRQMRPGLDARPFELVKFRTMSQQCGADGELLPDAQRLGAVGRFLRASSLDELPELLNVLRGEMSLVGPRPLLVEYLPLYSPAQARRHEVRPGLTGWAQVNGRNSLSWDDKFAADVWYVDNRSPWLDCKILGLTLLTLLGRRGINAEGSATMPPFTGNTQ